MKIKTKLLSVTVFLLFLIALIIFLICLFQMDKFGKALMEHNLYAKLTGDINSAKLYLEKYHGALNLLDNKLIDKAGNNIENSFEMVDALKKDLNVVATIFKKTGDNFIRVSTTIMTSDGKRAVGTELDKNGKAYSSAIEGKQYIGDAEILGSPFYTAYIPLADGKNNIGILFIGISKTESLNLANSYLRETTMRVVLIALAIIVFFVVISILLNNKIIIKPIISASVLLNKSITDEGHLDLTKSIMHTSNDEIGEMAVSLDTVFSKTSALVSLVKNQTAVLQNLGLNLSGNMTETAATINEINNGILNVKNQTLDQQSSVSETSAAMINIINRIEQLDAIIVRRTKSLSESFELFEKMLSTISYLAQILSGNNESMTNLAASSEDGSRELATVVSSIKNVAKESDSLLEISALIQDIASRTSLLSMNAAIEAARAGERGKGFSVVAGEIRHLAESSNQQASTVANVLSQIKTSIENITKSAESVLSRYRTVESAIHEVSEKEQSVEPLSSMRNVKRLERIFLSL